MFRFAHPIYLYLLLIIPVWGIVYMLIQRKMKSNLLKFGNMELLKRLMPDVSPFRKGVKFFLLMLALALLIIIIARPQFGTRNEQVKRSGIEAIIAVDVSNSMLCQDIQPNRLEKTKMIVSKLINQFDNDRVGLVVFAGKALTLLPVTSDYVSAKMFLDQFDTSTVSLQGTNMADAIRQALKGYTSAKNVGRALILITDAEDNEDGAIEAAKEAKKQGVRVFVLSVGTEAGGPIPMGNGSYKTDNAGNTVMTRLNEKVGKEVAQAGDGIYIHVDQTEKAQDILENEIENMQKEVISATMYSEYDEQFVAVAILLLIVLIAEICVAEKKNPFFLKTSLFKKKTAAVFIIAMGASQCAFSQTTDRDCIRMGNSYFREGQYSKAETYYRKALDKKKSMEAYYNLANSLVMQQQDSTAFEQYKLAVETATNNKFKKAMLFHNMGNLLYASRNYDLAAEMYKHSLRCNPNDDETRYNLAMALYQLKNNKGNNNNNQDKKQDNKDENKQNNQNKQKQEQKNQEKKENKPKPVQEISKEAAEQLLNSAQQDEKAVIKKVKEKENNSRPGKLQKDW